VKYFAAIDGAMKSRAILESRDETAHCGWWYRWPRVSSDRDCKGMDVSRNGKGSCAGGNTSGIEMKLVPQAGLPLETLRAAGLKGKGGTDACENFATLAPGMLDAFSILRKHKPVAAFGVGGYAAGPMMPGDMASRHSQRNF